MTMSGSRLKFVCVLVTCALGLTAWRAGATAPDGFTLTNIVGPVLLDEFDTKAKTDGYEARIKTKGASDVYVSNITIAPGGHRGWHPPPGPSIIMVKSGEATIDGDCGGGRAPHVYATGHGVTADA